MVLNDKVEAKNHDLYGFTCRGLFARELIKEGEVIWEWKQDSEELRTYHKHDIDAEPDDNKKATLIMFSYMLDDDLYGSTPHPEEDTSYYFNHSCEPNSWYQTDNYITAMRDIQPGEHITYDYAFTETEGSLHAGLRCLCGSSQCRKVLNFTEWRSIAWQKKYEGHYTAYIQKKINESGWYDPRVVLRHKGDEGSKGLFATADIKRNDVVLVFSGKIVGLDDLLASGLRSMELSLQISDNLWQISTSHGPETPDFINHSCEPNCGMEDSVTVVAMRDIKKGEELAFDYGTVNCGVIQAESDNFPCHCGATTCRGFITSRDWRLPDVQKRVWPYFPPFVKRLIMEDCSSKKVPSDMITSPVANGNGVVDGVMVPNA